MITIARLSAITRSRPQLRSSRRSGCAAPGATVVLISAFGSMFLTCEQLNLYHAASPRASATEMKLASIHSFVCHQTEPPVVGPPLPAAKQFGTEHFFHSGKEFFPLRLTGLCQIVRAKHDDPVPH